MTVLDERMAAAVATVAAVANAPAAAPVAPPGRARRPAARSARHTTAAGDAEARAARRSLNRGRAKQLNAKPDAPARDDARALAAAERKLDAAIAAAGRRFDTAWARAAEKHGEKTDRCDDLRMTACDRHDAAIDAAWRAYDESTAGLLSPPKTDRLRRPDVAVKLSAGKQR